MNIDTLTIEELQRFNGEELVNIMFSTLYEVKPIQVEKVDLSDLASTIYKADFGVVKKKIKYEDQEEHFHLALPVLDERKLTDNTSKLPFTNYFIVADYVVSQNPFGLLEIMYLGQHIRRNDNDFKHTRTELKYREFGYFYYDQEKQTYVQVPPDGLNKARGYLLSGKSIEKADEVVQKYIHREQLLEEGRGLLKQQGELFRKKLLDFKKQRANFGTSIKSILKYTFDYEEFLAGIDNGLKLYLLFGHLSVSEYEKLLEEKKRLLDVIDTVRSMLEEMSNLMTGNRKYGIDQNAIFTNTLRLVHQSEEDLIYTELKGNQLEDLKNFLVAGDSALEGYIGYDLDKWELYVNLVQAEERRHLTKETTDHLQEKEKQDKILRSYQKREQQKKLESY